MGLLKILWDFSSICLNTPSFIGTYEFYNRGDAINIQELINKLMADSAIDISAVS
jgi:hypothetical protein